MTTHRTTYTRDTAIAAAARAAKARRQVVLQRVRAQRAGVHKRTVADWMKEGLIIRASDLKEQSR